MTEKELLFCEGLSQGQSPGEAALKAGYRLFPEKAAKRLLRDKAVKAKCRKLTKNALQLPSPAAGLRRLAFGSICDAVKLLRNPEITDSEIEKMDLFSVSEIKKSSGGGMEIKFFDRLKALQMLADTERTDAESCDTKGFFDAIAKGAQASSLSERDDEK